MRKTKVLVVDDSAYNRRTITEMLEKSPHIEVLGTAADGEEGLKKALTLKPDIITLDLEMPVMDGFTLLRLLMTTFPIPVIVVSSRDDDANVFKALELGAVDFLAKPTARISKDLLNIEEDIISKVMMVSQLKMDNIQKRIVGARHPDTVPPRIPETIKSTGSKGFDILAIGASTGGPPALQSIFTSLPKDLPLSIIVSQHMPPGFTRAFAERLNRLSALDVKEAESGDTISKGRILIAPGGAHLTVKKQGKNAVAEISRKTPADMYAPSVDRMFSSVANNYKGNAIGLVLTGMGSDGKNGVIELKESDGFIIAESEESSIVYGMPKEAVKTGKVDKILPLSRIAGEIVNLCSA